MWKHCINKKWFTLRVRTNLAKWHLLFVLVSMGSLGLPAFAQPLPETTLPVLIADEHWKPLLQNTDSPLQQRLEKKLSQNKRWNPLIKQQKMGVGLVDLTDPQHIKFARVNGKVEMYAASLPKIAILLASFEAFEQGTLSETPETMQDLQKMIRVSSNKTATRMIDRLGGLKVIEAVLRDPRYELYDEEMGGGLWVGKRYAQAGNRFPDPLKGLSHAATVTQVSRFYYLLATGRLVSPERSQQMLQILSKPGISHKFVHSLKLLAPKANLYRKSGTWRNWHSDSVLVWGKQWRRYILVSMVEASQGEQILRNLVPAIEEVLEH
ncbi:MAG: serine hydrolase [SAR324 cluster bacterium]|nr:serine hydrolase [SAR324 cluster bacterium]